MQPHAIRDFLRQMLTNDIAPTFNNAPLDVQRQALDGMGASAETPDGLDAKPMTFAGMPAERLVPAGALAADRVVLYLHGGGFAMGSCASHRAIAGRVGDACRAPVILPEYRLAPEHPFPAGPDDALAAYRALLDEGHRPDGIVIVGDSAGGGLAAGLAATIARLGLPGPGAVVLMSPFVDMTLSGDSYRTRDGIDPWLKAALFPETRDRYVGGADPADPLVSPLFADLRGLPPTLIQVGDHEVLLDDSVRLAKRLDAAGVAVTLEVVPEMWHVFQLFAPALPEAEAALKRIGAFVEANLSAL